MVVLPVQGARGQEIREYRDILYVAESRVENDTLQRLNLVVPSEQEAFPLFVWIGGGAWSYVDRNVEMDFARQLAKRGVAVATIGHRLSPAIWKDPLLTTGIQHPKHIQDVAAAVKWLYTNGSHYGYDKTKIFIGGFSSGAHLAMLLTLDRKYLNDLGLSTDIIKGVVPVSGAYDILNYFNALKASSRPELADQHVRAVFGDRLSDFAEASPTSYLLNLAAPMLIITDYNMIAYTEILEQEIRKTDFNEFKIVKASDLSHGELWRDLSHNEDSPYRERIAAFIFSIAND